VDKGIENTKEYNMIKNDANKLMGNLKEKAKLELN